VILDKIRGDLDREDSFWPAQVTTLAVIALNFVLPARLTAGPWWLLPGLELVIVVALFWRQPLEGPGRPDGHRRLALALIALLAVATVVSQILLAHYLLAGGKGSGRSLLGAGVVLWANVVLVGGLTYWELDRGGPGQRQVNVGHADFLFTEMTDDVKRYQPAGWGPGFADYLYLSLTNCVAFSPTDTMPLTQRAKLLMGIQSIAAFSTLGLVVARAVNILG
jgi:hypothetical protein